MEPIGDNNSGRKFKLTMNSGVLGNDFDQKIDVVGLGDNECVSSEKVVNDPDKTEESSSFGNTFSGSEEESVFTDTEVESQFFFNNPDHAVCNGLSRISKKRRLTDHWRKYIRPLMWRCQWLELRMNELRSQTLLYEKELEAYRHVKQLNLEMMELDGSVSRAIPFSCQTSRRAMKRRSRKRIEDEVNVSSYMSSHNVFSYYEHKSTKTGCQSAADDTKLKEAEINKFEAYERALLDLRNNDDSLEEMILNLDHLQFRINSLKSKLNDVMPKHSNRNVSHKNNKNVVPSQTISDSELKVFGSSVSGFGDAGVTAIDDAPFCAKDLIFKAVGGLINGDTRKLNELTGEEEASYGYDDAMTYLKVPVQASAVIKTYTGKRRGRKPKKQLQGMMKKDEENNPYKKTYLTNKS